MSIKELWKPVCGYEGLYEVSNLGRVKSLPRETTKGKVLKPYINRCNGYVYYSLCKENKAKSLRAHVLVLEAFTDYKSRNGLVIDHIDGDKTNNSLENLEAVDMRENMLRAYKLGLEVPKGIEVINLGTGEKFISYMEASRSVGGNRGEMVKRVCDGKRSHYRGVRFARVSDMNNDSLPTYKGKYKKKASVALWR